MSPARIAGLAILAALGIVLVSRGSGSFVKKTFVYREIEVKLLKDEKGWYWQANPVKWPPKSFWEWIKWPLSGVFPNDGGTPFASSQAASLDAIRVIDETAPFE